VARCIARHQPPAKSGRFIDLCLVSVECTSRFVYLILQSFPALLVPSILRAAPITAMKILVLPAFSLIDRGMKGVLQLLEGLINLTHVFSYLLKLA